MKTIDENIYAIKEMRFGENMVKRHMSRDRI